MPRQKKHRFYVIRARPVDQGGGGGNAYYAPDGRVTTSRKRAEKFGTFGEAQDFANKHSITLGAMSYIDTEEFTDAEVE